MRVSDFGGARGSAILLHVRRQPLLAAAALFLAGIAWGYQGGGMLPAAALGPAAVFGMWRVRGRVAAGRAAVAWALVLAGLAAALLDRRGRDAEARRLPDGSARQTFTCSVGPEVGVSPRRGKAFAHTFRAERCVMTDGAFRFRALPVDVTWFGPSDAGAGTVPQPGERWRIRGVGRVKKGRDGLLRMTLNTGADRSERLAEADPDSWRPRITRARYRAAERLRIGIEGWGDVPALYQAMLLGNRHVMPAAVRRAFADSGTIHVFAISGLHIVLVAAVLTLAVTALGVPRTHWLLCVGPPLVFYTALTGARPSAVRACLMALLYFLAPLVGRRPNALAALAGTALIVHAFQPWRIFDIGCVLSFAVMAGLVVFCRFFCEAGHRLVGAKRLGEQAQTLEAAGSFTQARRIRWLRRALLWVSDSFAVSLAAWLASVPLTAYYFGRFTPGGLAANLVISPCSFFVVVAGCLGLIASVFSTWLASVFNHAAGAFIWLMMKTAQVTAACPGCTFRIAKWGPWAVWGWFGLLLLWAVWLAVRRPDGLAWLAESQGVTGERM